MAPQNSLRRKKLRSPLLNILDNSLFHRERKMQTHICFCYMRHQLFFSTISIVNSLIFFRRRIQILNCLLSQHCSHGASGIDKSLALERKIESRKRNFSLDLENLIVPISLSTLDFREWQETILFLLSIFESGKNKFSFHSRFSRVARQISLSTLVFFSIFESSNREFNIIYSRWFKIDQPISVPEV